MPAVKLDAASRSTEAWLRTWDRSPRATRERMLHELIREHNGQTAPEIERKLGIGASLLFTRLVSWLRLSTSSGGSVTAQLRAISLFVCAPAADRFRSEFSAVGGLQTVLDTVTLPAGALPPVARREALRLLTGVARASRAHKVAICELRASIAIVGFMHGCADDGALDAARELLVSLASANPAHAHALHADALELLSGRENARAQLYGAEAVREILAELSFDDMYQPGLGDARSAHEREAADMAERERALHEAEGRAQHGGDDRGEGAERREGDEAAPPAGAGALAAGDHAGGARASRRARGASRRSTRRSNRPSTDASSTLAETAARAVAAASDCVLGAEYVDAICALLTAFSVQTQREGAHLAALCAEHPSLHGLLALRLRDVLLDGRVMHAQAAGAHIVGQLLTMAGASGGANFGVLDDLSALAEHEAALGVDVRAHRLLLADRLLAHDAVPLVCLLLLHERSSECRRQAAVSLQAIVRHGTPAAAGAVQRYAAPVFDEILADPILLTAMPLDEAVCKELAHLLCTFIEMRQRAVVKHTANAGDVRMGAP